MFKFFEQLLDFIQHIGSKSAFHIFCNINRLARFEPKKLEHRAITNQADGTAYFQRYSPIVHSCSLANESVAIISKV